MSKSEGGRVMNDKPRSLSEIQKDIDASRKKMEREQVKWDKVNYRNLVISIVLAISSLLMAIVLIVLLVR